MADIAAMEKVVDGLLGAIMREKAVKVDQKIPHLVSAIADMTKEENLDELHLLVISEVEEILESAIEKAYGCSSCLSFLIIRYGFVEANFNRMYQSYEGSFACADKSRTVCRKIFQHLLSGDDIVFKSENYNVPKKILNDHDSIMGFFTALRNLYYGSPKQYLDALVEINKKQENNNANSRKNNSENE